MYDFLWHHKNKMSPYHKYHKYCLNIGNSYLGILQTLKLRPPVWHTAQCMFSCGLGCWRLQAENMKLTIKYLNMKPCVFNVCFMLCWIMGSARKPALVQDTDYMFEKTYPYWGPFGAYFMPQCTITFHRRRGGIRNSMQNKELSLSLVPIWSYTSEICCTRHEIWED